MDLELPAWRQRRLHLGLLHRQSEGFIEIGYGYRPINGKPYWSSRSDSQSFRPGGGWPGRAAWLEEALGYVASLAARPRHEIAALPSVRRFPLPAKTAVSHTRWLWMDVDRVDALPRLHQLLRERPAHLRIESAGFGGEHALWQLGHPLPARLVDRRTGEVHEWIERAHLRLVGRVGRWEDVDGTPKLIGADRACTDRSRLMRLAGTINYKSGRHARVIHADLALPPYSLRDLVGDLPDLPSRRAPRRPGQPVNNDDPYKTIAPATYFMELAGVEVVGYGLIRCPAPDHDDDHPSCNVGDDANTGWWCHGCARGGTIYDLASVLLGGPTGTALRGDAFRSAKALVVERCRRPA